MSLFYRTIVRVEGVSIVRMDIGEGKSADPEVRAQRAPSKYRLTSSGSSIA